MRNRQIQKLTVWLLGIVVAMTVICPSIALAVEPEQKVVRVGYVNAATYEEGGEGEYKYGYGYEYLQRISYMTGWKYEYVYGSFRECYEKLVRGEIDLFGNMSYTPERAELFHFSAYPQGKDTYLMYTTRKHPELTEGNVHKLNGCKIGVTTGSFQEALLKQWLSDNQIQADVVQCDGYNALMTGLSEGVLDAIVTPDLATSYDVLPIINIGFSDYYFVVAKERRDLLTELNEALYTIQNTELDYNNLLVARYQKQMTNNLLLNKKEEAWLAEHNNTIRIGYLANNLPYSTQLEDGSMGGVMKILADTLEDSLGIHVEFKCYNTNMESMTALEQGEIDVIGPLYGDYYLAEQKDHVLTDAFIKTSPVIIYKNPDLNVACQVIATTNESLFSEDVVRILFPDAEIVLCDGMEECLNAVSSGEAGSTLVTSMRLNVLRQYHAMDSLQFADTSVQSDICLATTKSNRLVASIFNKGIALSTDRLNGVALAENSYVQKDLSLEDFVQEYALQMFIIAVLIILVLGLLLYRMYVNEKKLAAALTETKREKEYAYQLHLSNNELKLKVNRDALTQIGNRYFFFTKLDELLVSNEQFVICFCDLDNLKYVNDTFGHNEGDNYLRSFVEVAKQQIRVGDIFARIGGDEFCILLRNCKYEAAVAKMEKIAHLFCKESEKNYQKNFSYGILEVPENHEHLDGMELVKQADATMYVQKMQHHKLHHEENS